MAIAHSGVTARERISVPAAVRKKLGVGPGSTLEWQEEGDKIVVGRAGDSLRRIYIEPSSRVPRSREPPGR